MRQWQKNVLRRRDEYILKKKKRSRQITRAAVMMSCVCLITVGAVRMGVKPDDTVDIADDTSNAVVEYKKNDITIEDKKEKIEKPIKAEININNIDDMMSLALDIDCQINHDVTADEFKTNTGIDYDTLLEAIPDSLTFKSIYSITTPNNGEYRHHDYVLTYGTKAGREAGIAMCSYEKPLRDWFIMCDDPIKSVISGVELIIYKFNDLYMTVFENGGVYYDVTADGIAENELKDLLTGLINCKPSKIEDVPADAHGIYFESIEIDEAEYYGGCYINDDGQLTAVLTNDTPKNCAEIKAKLGRDDIVFVKGKYTLDYLTKLQEKISQAMVSKELPFVISSALMERGNCIKVRVNTKDEALWEKIYELDTVGGAVSVEYTEDVIVSDVLEVIK